MDKMKGKGALAMIKQVGTLIIDAGKDWSEDNASKQAAALAYYAIFSLVPLLVILIAIVGFVLGDDAAMGSVSAKLEGYMGAETAELVEEAVKKSDPTSSGGFMATLVSTALLIFGASNVFLVLQETLNNIWEVEANDNIKRVFIKRFSSLGMILGLCFVLLISLIVSTVISTLSEHMSSLLPGVDFIWTLVNLGVTALVYTLLFGLLFKFVPDVEIRWKDVWFGALATTLLFMLGQWGLSYYLASNSTISAYGAAGAVLSMLVWVYYSAQIVFFGAELTQQWAQYNDHVISPSSHARWSRGAKRHRNPDPLPESI